MAIILEHNPSAEPVPPTLPQTIDPVVEPDEEPSTSEETPTQYIDSLVVAVVAAEAANEPYNGQMAVAQCIANTAKRKGISPADVVSAPGQYAPPRYDPDSMDRVRLACEAVFLQGAKVTDKPIEYFYAPAFCHSDWHESLTFVTEIGGHRFFMR